MSYLRYLCLFAHSGVQCILCYVFVLFFFVYVASFSRLSFLIAPSVFSNVCINNTTGRMLPQGNYLFYFLLFELRFADISV